jgi:hypothetical protein
MCEKFYTLSKANGMPRRNKQQLQGVKGDKERLRNDTKHYETLEMIQIKTF